MRLFATLVVLIALVSCKQDAGKAASHAVGTKPVENGLLRVGSVVVTQSDLEHELKLSHPGPVDDAVRKQALDVLARRAGLVQAALDAGLDNDPACRSEMARVLAGRLREKELKPRLDAVSGQVPRERLKEIYDSQKERFQSAEKRRVAVLWLDPGKDPARMAAYREKLRQAREWYDGNAEIKGHPEQGFAELSIDHSEHAASRFKGGVVGWMEQGGGMDAWSKAVAGILFSLKEPGDVSEIVARPEGLFLVRYLAHEPAFLKPFDTVADELGRAERDRLRKSAEAEFEESVRKKHPVEVLNP